MSWLRDLFFGNWRNKGVAFFFAVTIWFVVFQSEKQEHPANADVTLVTAVPGYVITRVECPDNQGQALIEFDGTVTLDFSGPRRQIENLRQELTVAPRSARLEIPLGPPLEELPGVFRGDYQFRAEDFGFPRNGIEIDLFTPEFLRVTQEELASREVSALERFVSVTYGREGFEVVSTKVEAPRLVLRGPKSVIEAVQPSIKVAMRYDRDTFKGVVPVSVAPAEGLARQVTVEPSEVAVEIVAKASTDVLSVDAVRITFRLPPLKKAVKIVVPDLTGDTIPVEFYGPKDRIAALKERLRSDPGFSVAVPVRPFDIEEGMSEQTFTEPDLEVLGFSDILKRPHRSRNPPVPWTYRIVAVEETEEKSGG
jgi:hypothetical protein